MKAIFLGSLVDGLILSAIVDDEAAEKIVLNHLTTGNFAEALDVQTPVYACDDPDETRDLYVVYHQGLQGGSSVYGPFSSEDISEGLAEEYVDAGDEWETFQVQAESSVHGKPTQKFTVIARVHETEDHRSFQISCEPTQTAVIAATEQALLQDMIEDGLVNEDDSVDVVNDRGYDLNAAIKGWHENVFDRLP